MANQLQQEVYQKEYSICYGPNNFDLAVCLCYPNSPNVHTVTFVINEKNENWTEVFLTKLESVKAQWVVRDEWEFEGIMMKDAQKEREIRQGITRIKGNYNSRTRTGKLYVLAHEQPKPIVEVLSLDEMCKRINAYSLPAFQIDSRGKNSWLIERDYLTNASQYDHGVGLLIKCSKGDYLFPTAGRVSSPLALEDGRVLFSSDGFDCTIYRPGTYERER